MRKLFLLGGRQVARKTLALVHVCLPTPVVHQAVCQPKVLATCATLRPPRTSATVSALNSRVCMRRVRFFFWSNMWPPFYAHFPERGCPPNRVKSIFLRFCSLGPTLSILSTTR